jgi:hypothetical protein
VPLIATHQILKILFIDCTSPHAWSINLRPKSGRRGSEPTLDEVTLLLFLLTNSTECSDQWQHQIFVFLCVVSMCNIFIWLPFAQHHHKHGASLQAQTVAHTSQRASNSFLFSISPSYALFFPSTSSKGSHLHPPPFSSDKSEPNPTPKASPSRDHAGMFHGTTSTLRKGGYTRYASAISAWDSEVVLRGAQPGWEGTDCGRSPAGRAPCPTGSKE